MKMHCVAFAAKWAGRGVSGETATASFCASAASKPSPASNEAKASPPTPRAVLTRKSRRVSSMMSLGSMLRDLFTGQKFIQIQQHIGHRPPGLLVRNVGFVSLIAEKLLEPLQFMTQWLPPETGAKAPLNLFSRIPGSGGQPFPESIGAFREHW